MLFWASFPPQPAARKASRPSASPWNMAAAGRRAIFTKKSPWRSWRGCIWHVLGTWNALKATCTLVDLHKQAIQNSEKKHLHTSCARWRVASDDNQSSRSELGIRIPLSYTFWTSGLVCLQSLEGCPAAAYVHLRSEALAQWCQKDKCQTSPSNDCSSQQPPKRHPMSIHDLHVYRRLKKHKRYCGMSWDSETIVCRVTRITRKAGPPLPCLDATS